MNAAGPEGPAAPPAARLPAAGAPPPSLPPSPPLPTAPPLLAIRDLSVTLPAARGGEPAAAAAVTAVAGVSFDVASGEAVGLVGESGAGKSLTALAVLRLLPPAARLSGRILLAGTDLLALPEPALQAVRGRRVGMVFQEPMTALNPYYTIGFQLGEALAAHRPHGAGRHSRREERERAVRLLERVAIPDARGRLDDYPHQLSGGQRQRVMVAMAIAGGPDLLIADEPTTALDVTLQAQILALLDELRAGGLALLLITHDMGAVAEICDRVVVLDAGRVVTGAEGAKDASGAGGAGAAAPASLRSAGAPGRPAPQPAPPDRAVLVAVSGLAKRYQRRRRFLPALAGVDLTIRRGECLAAVGESGSGKTTFARCLLGLVRPSAGRVVVDGEDLLALPPRELRRRRRQLQMVFQDPFDSLDPRQRVGEAVVEPLCVHSPAAGRPLGRRAALALAPGLLARVGLPAGLASRMPHQLSGGQRQRVGIARALAAEPRLLVADEPVSALDMSIRGQILGLLADLRQSLGLTLLLIAHDLAVVEQMADRVAVFYCGRIVELASREELFARPLHPYTASLLSLVPAAPPAPAPPPPAVRQEARDPRARRVQAPLWGEPPSALDPPPGCPFHPRCPVAQARCRVERPELLPPAAAEAAGEGRRVACFYPGSLAVAARRSLPPFRSVEAP